ncbi:MAG: cation-translocating P-type ATPase [Trueperaceae bacterium]
MRGFARAAVTTPSRRRLAWAGGLLLLGRLAAWRLGDGIVADAATLGAAVLAGWPIAARAWAEARRRTWGIPLLVTLAAGGAVAIGEFWEAAAVTFLFGLGAELEKGTLKVARGAVTDLVRLTPEHATIVEDRGTRQVPIQVLRAGDAVLVRPGERVPVDGEVTDGLTLLDERALTGESLPRSVAPGATVLAGSLAIDGAIRVTARGPVAESALAAIVRRVEQSQAERAPAQRMVERFARVYTPAVALGSMLAYLVTRDAHLALTLLVIACPGALVIATPVAVTAGLGRAARRGVLLRGGAALERTAMIDTVALDKTGTLTVGEPELREVIAFDAGPTKLEAAAPRHAGDGQDVAETRHARDAQIPPNAQNAKDAETIRDARARVLRWAALAEAGSAHPLARPILEASAVNGEPVPHAPAAFQQLAGLGVLAQVAAADAGVALPPGSTHEVLVGNQALLTGRGVVLDMNQESLVRDLEKRGRTPVLVAVDGAAVGVIGLADRIRPEAKGLRERLRLRGVRRLVILTGDRRAAAEAVAAEVDIDEVLAGLLPDDKLAAIERMRAGGRVVAMVGDGINDAPALSAADVGVAMGVAGTATALASSDVALLRDDLTALPEALGIARMTRAVLRQNLAIALVTVALLLAGVLGGALGMGGGMLVHQASILAVLGNAARLTRA